MLNAVKTKLSYKMESNTWVLACSDLHLATKPTSASDWVERELSRAIEVGSKHERGVIVLNGDIIEMWAGERPSVEKALKAHKDFTQTIYHFSKLPNHKVFYVVGNHDGKLGWDKASQKAAKVMLGAEICLSLELKTPQGNIEFEHGHSFDPDNSFGDPRDEHDTPLGQHIVQQALPLVKESQGKMLAGIDHLEEPHQFPKFVASRVMYREILNRSWWLLIPILFTLIARIVLGFGIYQFAGFSITAIVEVIILTELAVLINVALIVLVIVLILRHILKRAKGLPGQGSGPHHNDASRDAARDTIKSGNLGLVTGHTHRPEVSKIESGFYANSGSGTKMLVATKARFGLPKTYIAKNQLSWLEFNYTRDIEISLHAGLKIVGEQTKLENFMTRKRHIERPLEVRKRVLIEM